MGPDFNLFLTNRGLDNGVHLIIFNEQDLWPEQTILYPTEVNSLNAYTPGQGGVIIWKPKELLSHISIRSNRPITVHSDASCAPGKQK